jgi:aromatic ring-opening dioxygenase catalytic subunit (LigB family)
MQNDESAASAIMENGGDMSRMPVAFVPHGGGPWPFVEMGLPADEVTALTDYLQTVRALPSRRPRALLVVSAHWEEAVPTVMTAVRPGMYYDYYGFPPESYTITWPAPGAPDVAARVRDVLAGSGVTTAEDPQRGYDHGTFIPLKVAYPDADVPAVQLSLKRGLNPAEHIALGRALAPLRDDEVFIIASGMTFHNLRAFRDPRAAALSEPFDGWLQAAMQQPPDGRDRALIQWEKAPNARIAHPREEHLLPLMVAAGAAGGDAATLAFNGTFGGARLSAYHWGA